jgi:microcystin-dependent protein
MAKTTIKFEGLDETALASQEDAETGTASDVLMTPQRTAQAIVSLANRLGEIADWPFTTIPASKKALFCNGQTIGKVGSGATYESTEYEDLFNLLVAEGSKYGNTGSEVWASGNTVKLPDRRGYVAAGKDNMGGTTSVDRLTGLSGGVDGDSLGATGGSQSHTLTVNEMPSHSHDQTYFGNSGGAQPIYGGGNGINQFTSSLDTGTTGGGIAHNNIQPTVITNFIIFYS